MKLTLKQKRFADEYIISGNIEQSALMAGYSKNYARSRSHELLANVGIKTYIEERLKVVEDSKVLSIQEAYQITASIARGEPMKIKVMDDLGNQIEALRYPSFKDRNTAVEHFYRLKGEFIERKEIEHSGSVAFLDDIDES